MPTHRNPIILVLATTLVLLVAAPVAAAQQRVSAKVLLGQLKVASERSGGYDRALFPHWDSVGGGCDVRDRVLIAEARVKPRRTGGCRLIGGRWRSPFDNRIVSRSRDLDIDHMVPLAEAWRSGAHRWDGATRRAFANDLDYPLTLIAVTASANRSKSDQDPSQWLPTFNGYRCTYVASWIAVKWRWRLAIDRVERIALRAGLVGCGRRVSVPRPTRATITIADDLSEEAEYDGADDGMDDESGDGGDSGQPDESSPGGGTLDPRFRTCREAIAAGYGPYVRGVNPEYDWYRDGDKDGIVCER